MAIREKSNSSFKGRAALASLGIAIVLIGVSAPTLYDRYQAYVEAPDDPYRAGPLPSLPPLQERASTPDPANLISVIQIPPSINTGAPGARDGWIIGSPSELAAKGLDVHPSSRFRNPSKIFPGSTAKWHIERAPSQPLADLTFLDESNDDRYKVVKLKTRDGREVADLYLDGEPVRVMVPVGYYTATISVGRNWEGEETEFGPYGTYSNLSNIDLTQSSETMSYRHSILATAKALP